MLRASHARYSPKSCPAAPISTGASPSLAIPKAMLGATPPRRTTRSSTRNDSETRSRCSASSCSPNLPGKCIRWSVAMEPLTSTGTEPPALGAAAALLSPHATLRCPLTASTLPGDVLKMKRPTPKGPAVTYADQPQNELPQAHPPVALGLSIVKPCCSIVSVKSIVAPPRYGSLMRSTTIGTPWESMSTSPSRTRSSKNSWYCRPEHPPGCTATRSRRSSRPSWSSRARTFTAAVSVSESVLVCSMVVSVLIRLPGRGRTYGYVTATWPGQDAIPDRTRACQVIRTSPLTTVTGTGVSPVVAGPLSTFPLTSNREPWHGQANPVAADSKLTMQPWCGHVESNAVNCPEVS